MHVTKSVAEIGVTGGLISVLEDKQSLYGRGTAQRLHIGMMLPHCILYFINAKLFCHPDK